MIVNPIDYNSKNYVTFGNRHSGKLCKPAKYIKTALIGFGLAISTSLVQSCYKDEFKPESVKQDETKNRNYYVNDDVILPDTVNQPILQNIPDIHDKINVLFQSLNVISKDKKMTDVKSIEFEDINNNIHKYDEIKKTENGFELYGTVYQNNNAEKATLKFSDAEFVIHRPLIFVESSFNKIHNLSIIYQNQWRKGADNLPERRIFQNRTNQRVDSIDGREYYPYDVYNIFSLRKKENTITSKAVNTKNHFTEDDEFKNIKVIYKN